MTLASSPARDGRLETGADLIPAWGPDGVLRPVEKLEVHRRGLRHAAVSVFVMTGDRTLLQRRALTKYHTPGLWANACCTHPHWGEEPAAAAARRLREELGIAGLALRPRGRIEYRAEVGGGMVEHELVELFVAEMPSADIAITPNPAEVMEVQWMALGDLRHAIAAAPERFTPWLRIYLTRHPGQIFLPAA
ncbi:MAG TPA: isopentenyl-diphosphate Delta-isomerase [Paracoccaceae bacterium]|nr:isopentenyl-diphosphate Delta-isomerase [Paracoccaceae bacterium]